MAELELYLRDDQGTPWRVHDVVYGVPWHVRGTSGAYRWPPQATDRYFVREDGTVRSYHPTS